MRLPDLQVLRDSLEGHAEARQIQETAAVNEVAKDTVKFLEQYCKLKPYGYLVDLIQSYEKFHFNAVRWPRQTGKVRELGRCTLPMLGVTLI